MVKPRLFIFLTAAIILLLSCGLPGLQDGYLNLDFELSESRFEEMLQEGTLSVNGQTLFEQVTAVEFSDGVIHVEGSYAGGTAGYVDLALSAADGALVAEVLDHNVSHLDADLSALNQALATSLTGATGQGGEVIFDEVRVTDEAIVMDLRVRVLDE